MPEKAATQKKGTEAKKTIARKRVNKGESVVCEVCGLSVVIEEVGGIAVSEETTLLCCGKAMKARKPSAKAKTPTSKAKAAK